MGAKGSSAKAGDTIKVCRFSYAELEAATEGFASASFIGKGGFGHVFRGKLPDGTPVAVKRIKEEAWLGRDPAEVRDEFLKEARLMGAASRDVAATVAGGHRPLLSLLGICDEEDVMKLCLVMPLMAGGSLADHIEHPRAALLTGRQRVTAALDAARGVAALHSLRPKLLHRDIKTENVLLDGELRAYVADYGLSRVLPGNDTSVESGLLGTLGCVAPEAQRGRYSARVRGGVIRTCSGKGGWGFSSPHKLLVIVVCVSFMPGCCTSGRALPPPCLFPPQTDVYAFGVLMLQLATNLPSMLDLRTSRSLPLNAHVRVRLLGEVWDDRLLVLAADGHRDRRPEDVTPAAWAALPRADTRAWEQELPMLASFGVLALRCTVAAPDKRPSMADVVEYLESMLAEPEPRPPERARANSRGPLNAPPANPHPAFAAPIAALAGLSHGRTAITVAPDGTVREPASGAFDVTMAPGELVQAAVDRCPLGGSVLLLPGTHYGALWLPAGKEVHCFGRGLATLRTATGTVVKSEATMATLDGLIVRCEAAGTGDSHGVWILEGRLRLQACDIASAAQDCVYIQGGDPVLAACRCVRAWAPSFRGASRLSG